MIFGKFIYFLYRSLAGSEGLAFITEWLVSSVNY